MIVCKPLNGRSIDKIARRQADICYRPAGSKSYRPYGTGRFFLIIPGTSCQAIFTRSLRDTDPIATQFFNSLLGLVARTASTRELGFLVPPSHAT
jgi:hypothetical protein